MYLAPIDNTHTIAPTGGVTANTPVLVGGMFGVPWADAAEGASFALRLGGVLRIKTPTGVSYQPGDRVDFDPGTGLLEAPTTAFVGVVSRPTDGDEYTEVATSGFVMSVPS